MAGLAPGGTARFLATAASAACRPPSWATAAARRTRRAGVRLISLAGDADLDADPAAVLLLQPRLDLFADLWEVARTHAGEARSGEKFVLVPNLLCVAGAFFFGGTA